MTTAQTCLDQKQTSKKRQKSFSPVNIGTPLKPVRPRSVKQQECEQLSDWQHSS